jgi:hypothetical protein
LYLLLTTIHYFANYRASLLYCNMFGLDTVIFSLNFKYSFCKTQIKVNGWSVVAKDDIREVEELFFDEKSLAKILSQLKDKYMKWLFFNNMVVYVQVHNGFKNML